MPHSVPDELLYAGGGVGVARGFSQTHPPASGGFRFWAPTAPVVDVEEESLRFCHQKEIEEEL
jgi:hypothetical protein